MFKFTIAQFNETFPTEDSCLEFVRDMIYPEGITCRKCDKVRNHHKITGRKAYACSACGTHAYPLAGTIFEKSSTPLKSWFYAMYLMACTRCGISAKQLERELGVTYKTAWRMFKQIRTLFDESLEDFAGEVEADETYIGGRRHGTPPGRPGPESHKSTVVGVVERGGRVAALVTKDASKTSVEPIVTERVLPSAMVYTDEWAGYDELAKRGYSHKRIPHAEKVYVMGNVHTNTIEGFWSLLKRGISGVYHSVSAHHLQSYINEYAFRYNHRDDESPMFLSVTGRIGRVRAGKYGEYNPVV